jgi:hypothetical protein
MPFVLSRRTQKPFSSLWKVTRSMTPEISSVTGRRKGIAAFMRGDSFSSRKAVPCLTHPGRRPLGLAVRKGFRSSPQGSTAFSEYDPANAGW